MKTLSKYLCLFVLSLFVVACSDSSSPEKVAKDFTTAIFANDINNIVDLMYIPDEVKNQPNSEEMVKGKMAMMLAQGQKQTDKKGGVSSISTSDVKIDDDKVNATVSVTIKFKDGTQNIKMISLIKVDNKWLVKL